MAGLGPDDGPREWRQNAILLMAGLGLTGFGAAEVWKPTFRAAAPTLGIVLIGIGLILLLVAWRRIKGPAVSTGRETRTRKEVEAVSVPAPKSSPWKWEKRVEVIPQVLIALHGKPKEYAAVLTDLRTIFTLRPGGGLLGRMGGPKTRDPYHDDPSDLAESPDSIVIPHGSLRKLGIRKGEKGAFRIEMRYEREDGMEENLEATLLPPERLFSEGKAKQQSRAEVEEKYAEAARGALQRAVPRVR
jgi:hypothetical protein